MKHALVAALLMFALPCAGSAETAAPRVDTAGDSGGVVFRVALTDSSHLLGSKEALFRENVLAAAKLWSAHLKGKTELTLHVRVEPGNGRAYTKCPRTVFVKKFGANSVFEPSATAKIRTGHADTGGQPDIDMLVCGDYLAELWLDPEPDKRTAQIDPHLLDAMSLFQHEIAHGLGFNGWLDGKTGDLAGSALSPYDRHVTFDGGEFYFVGLRAMKVQGGPVLLSRRNNNYHHLGREGADCPVNLRDDLMSGVIFEKGRRFGISSLDLAILEDCGMPVK